MRYTHIAIGIIIFLLIGCVAEEVPEEEIKEEVKEPEEPQQEIEEPVEEPQPEPEEEQEPEAEPLEEEIEQPETGEPELSEKEQILNLAKTKIKSYSYRYKSPTGRQYNIYVKGNKVNIDDTSDDYNIYLDKGTKTAEKYCTSYTRCGREWGKISDLDYYDAYIETPIDWVDKITEAKKVDEGIYYGRESWKLNTNIGEVIIDSNFGFIYSIKQEDKTYTFLETKFNTVKDSDVNIPEYLLPE